MVSLGQTYGSLRFNWELYNHHGRCIRQISHLQTFTISPLVHSNKIRMPKEGQRPNLLNGAPDFLGIFVTQENSLLEMRCLTDEVDYGPFIDEHRIYFLFMIKSQIICTDRHFQTPWIRCLPFSNTVCFRNRIYLIPSCRIYITLQGFFSRNVFHSRNRRVPTTAIHFYQLLFCIHYERGVGRGPSMNEKINLQLQRLAIARVGDEPFRDRQAESISQHIAHR